MSSSRRRLLGLRPGAGLLVAVVAAGLLVAVHPSPASAAVATPTWHGEYFDNQSLSGTPVLVREDPTVDFDWGNGRPDPSVPANHFSVRWTRTLDFAAGTWRFTTVTDDGVRLYVDGELKIDHWVDQSSTEWTAEVQLTAGTHTVVMEYYDNQSDAVARLLYGRFDATIPPDRWKGEYFANAGLSGQPAMVRGDATINFDWGTEAPAEGLPVDNFSVRWTRTLTLTAGNYKFGTTTDDGVRLYVDGALVIDHWVDQPSTYYETTLELSAGDHLVVMEYYERAVGALARLSFSQDPATDGTTHINAGGGSYMDSFGNLWSADKNFSGGVTATYPQDIANTTDDALYTSEHAGNFAYRIQVPNGDHIVRLHFAELLMQSPGARQFDVSVEGTKVLSRFDIYARASRGALITRSFPATVTDGVLDVDFKGVVEHAVVQALDVFPAATTSDLDSPTAADIPEPENASFSTPPTVTVAFNDNVSLKDGYWRLDEGAPQKLFSNLGGRAFDQQFTVPVEAFNALPIGAHTLSFGVNDHNGNAWTTVWRFRKVDSGSTGGAIAFNRRTLASTGTPGLSALSRPTTVQFGPDGRLYVGQMNGYVHALTLDANRNVVAVQRIDTIHDTPNQDASGSPSTTTGRLLLGLDFDPASTPQRPILWAAHSDPRFCFSVPAASCPVHINSGVLTRLVGPSFDAADNRKDYVTGLPRSREQHAPNAVHFGPDGWLYLTIGSDTNYGAPSTPFGQLAERYLTASVLRVNVNGNASAFPIDVRNVTGPAGELPNTFELYATGYRNGYDFLWHSNGKLYLNGNAGNGSAGTTPGPNHGCPNGIAFDPGTRSDYLAIVAKGDYGGHPDPARGECVLDDGSMYPTPLAPLPNYRKPILYYSFGTSSDGMAEYKAPTFGGQMLGNIISATYAGNQSVRRVVLSDDGSSVKFEENLGIFNQPLDVAVGSEGSIYVAEYGGDAVQVMEPNPPLRGDWQTLPPLPTPTQEVAVTGCDGKVYVMGGLTAPNTDTNDVWVYDSAAKTWLAAAPYPGISVDHAGAACVDGTVYLIGGLKNGQANAPVATVFAYDPSTDRWSQKASLPKARGAMGVATVGGKIYAAGGVAGAAVADMAVYEPATNSWRSLAPMPTPRDHLVMEAVGGKLYAIGGRTVMTNSVLATNEQYDPAADAWSPRAPMPVARGGMASAHLHGHVQVWGGEGPSGTPTGTYPQGTDYDPATDTWIPIADQLTPRHGTGGATIGTTVYVPAGGPQIGGSVSAVNEAFSFISSAAPTTCVPAGSDPATTDSDQDRYTNKDENDNGTNPCSAASVPPDNDQDFVSDVNDPDDDNDQIPDADDQFQFDAGNGAGTTLPWVQNWNPGDAGAGKFGNSGFPGVQLTSNGTGFLGDRVFAGGAGGYLALRATAGTNLGSANSQDNALQVGFDATKPTTISAQLTDPLSGQTAEAGKSGGIFFGLDEDNYVKLVLATDNGSGKTGIQLVVEANGTPVVNPGVTPVDLALPGPANVELFLTADPANQRVLAQYRVDSTDPAAIVTIGSVRASAFPALTGFFKPGAAAGILTTNPTTTSFSLAYDYFRLDPAESRLVVKEALVPASDPGRFNLQIDGTTVATDVGHGGTSGARSLAAGTHTVSQTAGTGTSLADYLVEVGGDCTAAGAVTLAAGDVKTCTITSTRRSGPASTHVSELLTTNSAGTPTATFSRGGTLYWRARILDQSGQPESGAAVTTTVLRPGGGVLASHTQSTAGTGWALFSRKLPSSTGTYTIRVDQVAKTGTTYNASANVVSSVTFRVQ
jgi:Malectin domain/PA14 domain/Kelch motif/Glucose / Sorbosone dehydrogenase